MIVNAMYIFSRGVCLIQAVRPCLGNTAFRPMSGRGHSGSPLLSSPSNHVLIDVPVRNERLRLRL